MKQGSLTATELESKAKEEPKTETSKTEAEKPNPVLGSTPPAEPPPPVEEAKPADPPTPEPAIPELAKPDPIAEKLAEPPPPEPPPGPTPDELKKQEVEKRAADEAKKAEEAKKKVEDDKKTAEAEKEKKRKAEEEKKKKKLAEEKAKKRKEEEAKKQQSVADRMAALLDKDPTKKGAPLSGTQPTRPTDYTGPTAGASKGDAARLSVTEQALLKGLLDSQIAPCWRYPGAGGGDSETTVSLAWRMRQDGSLASEPTVVVPASGPVAQLVTEAAIRAVKGCQPYNLPPDLYETGWREIRDWKFKPPE